MKDFEKNYLEDSDSGVLVKYIGKNGIDIDDYIQSLLEQKDQEWKKRITEDFISKDEVFMRISNYDMVENKTILNFNEVENFFDELKNSYKNK